MQILLAPFTVLPFHLARSLHSLGNSYRRLGRHEEALVNYERAISLSEPLARDQSRIYKKDLAVTLYILSHKHYELNHCNDALESAQQSLDIYRELALTQPLVFHGDVVEGLELVRDCLSMLSRQAEVDEINSEIARLRAGDENTSSRSSSLHAVIESEGRGSGEVESDEAGENNEVDSSYGSDVEREQEDEGRGEGMRASDGDEEVEDGGGNANSGERSDEEMQ
ncbi:hypothetical protein NLI96_g12787 [Meripilus lineatus]|uniref:Uncharacterized protein n=1 Tax=Meripilus lineatus TaxID=2056292 RepID=A0AAD5Y9J6_9APHY|nr:hypothetical protein NLI96_g12787 [Physisporinus lineatus]